jgi:hypothetical protein
MGGRMIHDFLRSRSGFWGNFEFFVFTCLTRDAASVYHCLRVETSSRGRLKANGAERKKERAKGTSS